MFSGIISLRGNTCAQVFTNGKHVQLEPGERKSRAGKALGLMIDEVGIPDKTGKKSEFMRLQRCLGYTLSLGATTIFCFDGTRNGSFGCK
jgi:hypothetical protein